MTTACVVLALTACSTFTIPLDVAPPQITGVDGRSSELRILSPSTDRPVGGAAVRLWSRIENPNAFGLSITTIAGDLFLGDGGALRVDFPLGLPLAAQSDTVVPLDVSVGFEDLPALGTSLVAAALEGALEYRLEATIGVDAGMLGQPTFGPLTALSGTLRVSR
ncbi:MAG: LEA type 2 family protein [Gemmatimonadota bacterium]|nr:LEA type 2 family protein [Gemmatimonadota bacterium]